MNKHYYIFGLVTSILCFIFLIIGVQCGLDIAKHNNDNIDTTYNKVILDSINVEISKKDSVINNLKQRMNYEIEQAVNANDSIAVWQFQILVKGK